MAFLRNPYLSPKVRPSPEDEHPEAAGPVLATLKSRKLVEGAIDCENIALFVLLHLHQYGFEEKLGGYNAFALQVYRQFHSENDKDETYNRLSGNYYTQIGDAHRIAKTYIVNMLANKLHPTVLRRFREELATAESSLTPFRKK